MNGIATLDFVLDYKKLPFDDSFKKFFSDKKTEIVQSLLREALFPKKIEGIMQGLIFPNSFNVQGELAYILAIVVRNKNQINQFLENEFRYEQNLLNENYTECLAILDRIENEISVSLWGIENRFNLMQQIGGIERNWELLNEISKIKKIL
ncbi:MAG: hypothetical protein L6264_13270 [Weeksellaceae bacterium]|nr:hypothetical protein [Weeksellaceae bacterium]